MKLLIDKFKNQDNFSILKTDIQVYNILGNTVIFVITIQLHNELKLIK